ncbi:MAG: protein phosphatase 2C domain-containing protein [Candidatus Nanoarchaeia archaeon]
MDGLYGLKEHIVIPSSQRKNISSKRMQISDLEVEVSFGKNGCFVRAGRENLKDCQDYAGILFDEDEGIKVGIVADGVSQTLAGQSAAYAIVPSLLQKLRYFDEELDEIVVREMLSELPNPLVDIPGLYGEEGSSAERRGRRRVAQEKTIGSTTFLAAYRSGAQLHIFGVGDCGGSVILGDEVIEIGKIYFGPPAQIAYLPDGGIKGSEGDVYFYSTEIVPGNAVVLVTDGCLKNRLTGVEIGKRLSKGGMNEAEVVNIFMESLARYEGAGLRDDATLAYIGF